MATNTRKRLIRVLLQLSEESTSKPVKMKAAQMIMQLTGWDGQAPKKKKDKSKADKLLGI